MVFRRKSQRIFGNNQLDSRLKAGLITHLIDGGSGNTWIDRSGYSRNGTLQSGASWSLGQENKRAAVRFDGTDDNVAMGNPYPALGTEYTVACWINVNTTASPNGVVVYRSSAGSNPILFQLDTSGTAARFIVRDDAGTLSTASGGTVTAGRWHHLLGVRRGASTAIWLDGVAVGSGGASWGTITPNVLSVGCIDQNGSKSAFTTGRIEDVRVYNRVLSFAERVLLASPNFSPVVPMSRRLANLSGAAPAVRTTDFFPFFA